MIRVLLSGSPYEMGYQHGQALRPLVDGMLRYESRRHVHTAPAPLNQEAVLARVGRAAPELLEELHGIADGSGLPFEGLLEVNLRVLHYCTVIAFTHSDSGPLLGKNLDFPVYAYQVLFTVEPKEGHGMTHIGCAGSVASYGGINSAGLAMGHAVVPLDTEPQDAGLPIAFLRRLALQRCATTAQAVDFLRGQNAWQRGDNLLFLDREGEAAVVELAPGAQRVRRSAQDAVWCSNSFVHPDLATGSDEARLRYHYIGDILSQARRPLTHGLLGQLLSSHDGPAPLCRDSTQLSLVAYPASGRMDVADGYPCQVGYADVEGKWESMKTERRNHV
jgi:isopenicillin-N N-acyltransferase-like protein